jgi:hypothetical protein
MNTTPLQLISAVHSQLTKAVYRHAGYALLVLCCLCCANLSFAAEPVSLVKNGGFETRNIAGDSADGWILKIAFCSEERKMEGQASLQLQVQQDDAKKIVMAEYKLDPGLFKTGDQVELSLYTISTVEMGPGPDPYARIQITDANWKAKSELKLKIPRAPSSEWKKLSGLYTIPPEFTADSRIRIQIVVWIESNPKTPGSIFVDDVKLIKTSSAAQ